MTAWIFLAAITTAIPRPHDAAVVDNGRLLYTQKCASCHGADFGGSADAPSLVGVGAAAVDFWIRTGRMPGAIPWIEIAHQRQQIPDAQVTAIERYLAQADPTGPAIPTVSSHGDANHGGKLFVENCEHCHGVDGEGASISNIQWAPSLHEATPVEIAEAIRTGPQEMPRFSQAQFTKNDVDDIIAYVRTKDEEAVTPSVPTTTSGPVPEGLIGWLVIGLLCVGAFAYSRERSSKQ